MKMKRQIRQGAFETNSSSNHVLLITKNDHILTKEDAWHKGDDYSSLNDDELEYIYIDGKGEAELGYSNDDYSFGRSPFKFLYTAKDKARYVIAAYCNNWIDTPDDKKVAIVNEVADALHEIYPELENIKLPQREIIIYNDLDGNELESNKVKYNFKVSEDSAMYHVYYTPDGKMHPAKESGYVYDTPDIPGIDHQSMGLLENFLKKYDISIRDFILNKKYIVVINSDELQYYEKLKNSGLLRTEFIEVEFDTNAQWEDENKGEEE